MHFGIWGSVGLYMVLQDSHLPLPARSQAQMGNSKRKWDDTYDNAMAGRCQDELMRAQARRRGHCGQLQTATEEAQPLLQSAAATGAQQVARQAAVRRSVVLSTIGVQVRQPLKKENFITKEEALALGKTDLATVWSHIYGRCVGLWTYADRCGKAHVLAPMSCPEHTTTCMVLSEATVACAQGVQQRQHGVPSEGCGCSRGDAEAHALRSQGGARPVLRERGVGRC
jgi:hypothetical protein